MIGLAPHKRTLFGAGVLALVAVAVYANTLGNEFAYDDRLVILTDSQIQSLGNWKAIILDPRWMKTLTFMVDYHLWGFDPFGYHLTNILLHGLVTATLFFLLRAVALGEPVAWIATLLFAIHPIHTEVVANIANRKDALATFFVLLALIFYIKQRSPGWTRPLSWLSYLLALASKEVVGIALVPLMLLFDVCLRPRGKPRSIRQVVFDYGPYGLLSIGAVAWLFMVKPPDHEIGNLFALPLAEHVTTVLRAFTKYLILLVWPFDLNADHVMQMSASLATPAVIAAIVVMVAYLALSIASHRVSPEAAFGLWWIVLAWLPISNLVPITTYYVADRYFYLPSVGFCLVVAVAIERLLARCRPNPSVWGRYGLVVTIMLSTGVFYGWLTYHRNRDWRSDLVLWTKTVTQSPLSANAHFALGRAYSLHRQDDLAVRHLIEATRLAPGFSPPHSALGDLYLTRGNAAAALREFTRAVELKSSAVTHHDLGVAYARLGDVARAEQQFRRALDHAPGFAAGHYQLGVALEHLGHFEEAATHYRAALKLAGSGNGALAQTIRQRLQRLPGARSATSP